MVLDVSSRIDKISNKVKIQSSSLASVYEEALSNQLFLACKPSINPISPADPFWYTSYYGYRNDPFTHRRTAHHGIDLAGREGTDIHCSGEGIVSISRVSKFGYGKEVVVDHGFGYTSRYAHLQDILVEKGQKIKRGELVGTMGNTGRSTGPHLHYEIRKDGKPVNPMYFFYEVGIVSAQIFGKKKPKETDDVAPAGTSGPAVSRPVIKPAGVVAGGDDDYVSVPDSGPR